MARPREFDEAAVLEAAIQCFWMHGYEGTSVRHLAERMGITGASLYNAFGDKHALYQRALLHYREQGFDVRIQRLEGNLPPRQAIATFFDELVGKSLSDPEHKGCLLVNTALERSPYDDECKTLATDFLHRAENFFLRCLNAGQADGSISRAQPAEDLARLLLSMLLGIRVLARARPERALLEGIVRPVAALLDPPLH
ncbi:TetR/AcrR family transcriptional repressor of nem operon [Pseudomonas sp. JUb42]|uniref:TetR/AcrR family transcriptional regulator n=1 Tax=Pseudomonas sp. JUb42 TaxID=2940611 RepID=UPI002167FD95|nr:TetR/AcrR family transcriptional regulator [Pseudomonas sp. JUb42]MCS3471257.1 TetR/AcrR family transcriptional repressor of nem operon [Pseudomonas sp. JUb42]